MASIYTTFAAPDLRRFGVRLRILAPIPLRPRSNPLGIHSGSRLGSAVSLHLNRTAGTVLASCTNPSNPETTAQGKADSRSSCVADGPPLPTILAGVFVFLLVCWVIGSFVMWLVGLIVNPPQP